MRFASRAKSIVNFLLESSVRTNTCKIWKDFFKRLQFRYGDNNELVMALKHELESLKARKSLNAGQATQDWGSQNPGEASAPFH